MLAYVCLGTNDLPRATRFYDELLQPLGAKHIWETERFVAFGNNPKRPLLLLIKPYDGSPATVGNGTMVALATTSKEQVDAVHQKALALGGKDEGGVGPRGENFYGGYFRDLEGNKLVVCFIG